MKLEGQGAHWDVLPPLHCPPPPLHPPSTLPAQTATSFISETTFTLALPPLLFKQKLLRFERQQIKLMGLMQTLSFSAIQNNRLRGPHMFQHEDISMWSDIGDCWCSAKSYTLNTHTSHYCMHKASLISWEVCVCKWVRETRDLNTASRLCMCVQMKSYVSLPTFWRCEIL